MTPDDTSTTLPSPFYRLALLMALSGFLVHFDFFGIIVASPAIGRELGADTQALARLIFFPVMTIAALILFYTRVADIRGDRRVFFGGLVVACLGAIVCGWAPGMAWLLVGRLLLGWGGAMLFAPLPDLMARSVPMHLQPAAGWCLAAGHLAGALLGAFAGGLVAEHGWHWLFRLYLPGLLVALPLAWFILPPEDRNVSGRRIDRSGAVFSAVALLAVVLGCNFDQNEGELSQLVLAGAALSVVLAYLFMRRERHYPDPLVDVIIFRDRRFALLLACRGLGVLAVAGPVAFLPLYLQSGRGLSPLAAALLTAIMPPAVAGGAGMAALLAAKKRSAPQMARAGGLALSGLAFLAAWSAALSFMAFSLVLPFSLFAFGVVFSALSRWLRRRQPGGRPGSAALAGAYSFFAAMTLGVVLAEALLSRFAGGDNQPLTIAGLAAPAVIGAYQSILYLAGGALLVMTAAIWLIPRDESRRAVS